MQTFDFTLTGGFPMTQDVTGIMQKQYFDGFAALMDMVPFTDLQNVCPALTPGDVATVLSGCDILSGSVAAGGVIAPGFFIHKTFGLVPFSGGSFGVPGSATSFIVFTEVTESYVFADNIAKPVKITRTASLGAGATGDNISIGDLELIRINNFLSRRSIMTGQFNLSTYLFDYSLNKMDDTVWLRSALTITGVVTAITDDIYGYSISQTLNGLPSNLRPAKPVRFHATVTLPTGDPAAPIFVQASQVGSGSSVALHPLNVYVEIRPNGDLLIRGWTPPSATTVTVHINQPYNLKP